MKPINFLIYLWNQQISPWCLGNEQMPSICYFFWLNLSKNFEEIIKEGETVKNCTIAFTDCICNHYNIIGFNWKSNELEVFANFPNIEREIGWFWRQCEELLTIPNIEE